MNCIVKRIVPDVNTSAWKILCSSWQASKENAKAGVKIEGGYPWNPDDSDR
jgi:hypothetical protein